MQKCNSHRTEFYNAVFAFREEVKRTAKAANRTLPDVRMTQVPVSASENKSKQSAIHRHGYGDLPPLQGKEGRTNLSATLSLPFRHHYL